MTSLLNGWITTEKLINDIGNGPFVQGKKWIFKLVPVSKLERIPFEEEEYFYNDPRGGIKHVEKLADLISSGVAMEPAVGYKFKNYYVVHDGNHRVAAAVMLGAKKIPMVIYETSIKEAPFEVLLAYLLEENDV